MSEIYQNLDLTRFETKINNFYNDLMEVAKYLKEIRNILPNELKKAFGGEKYSKIIEQWNNKTSISIVSYLKYFFINVDNELKGVASAYKNFQANIQLEVDASNYLTFEESLNPEKNNDLVLVSTSMAENVISKFSENTRKIYSITEGFSTYFDEFSNASTAIDTWLHRYRELSHRMNTEIERALSVLKNIIQRNLDDAIKIENSNIDVINRVCL